MKTCSVIVLAAYALLTSATFAAKEVHLDLWLTSAGGSMVTGGWDHNTGKVVNPSMRVFSGELGLDPTFPFSGDEPGIGSNLIGSVVSMNLLAGLSAWNGAGYEASGNGLLASYGGQDAFSTSGGSFNFLVNEGLDLHPEFTLFSTGTTDPVNGIYLASFTASTSGLATSEVFYVVFNLGMSEEDHQTAIDWANNNLVPAPLASLPLALAALITSGRSRTRRQLNRAPC